MSERLSKPREEPFESALNRLGEKINALPIDSVKVSICEEYLEIVKAYEKSLKPDLDDGRRDESHKNKTSAHAQILNLVGNFLLYNEDDKDPADVNSEEVTAIRTKIRNRLNRDQC